MNEKLARRIQRLEAQAAEREAIDRANAPPPWKSWGDPEARALIAAAILRAIPPGPPGWNQGGPPKRLTPADREAIARAAREMDDLIVAEGVEAARRAYDAACEQDPCDW